MLPWQIISIGVALLLLTSCGNKGDLFLLPTEITEEQLESIDEAIEAIDPEDELGDQPNEDPSEDPTENKKKNNES